MQAGEDMGSENNPVALAQAYAQLADLEMEFDQAEAELRMFFVPFSPLTQPCPSSFNHINMFILFNCKCVLCAPYILE